jgi:malyl-CoA/(S)-citramalyl-CoA lyase
MSFKLIEQAPARLNRSELAVPGSQPKLFEKAAKSEADVIFLDLEDAVAPDDKPQARKNIIQALNEIDWGTKTMSVRINGLDTHFMYRDVIDVIEQTGERLDLIMIPKVGTAADVYAVDMLVTQCEQARGRKKRIGFEMIIETALGMQNVHEIAAASPRTHDEHRRRQSGLLRADRQGGGRQPRGTLGRHVALRDRAHGGRSACERAASDRRSVRRFLRP